MELHSGDSPIQIRVEDLGLKEGSGYDLGLLSPEDLGRGNRMKGGWVSMRKPAPPTERRL